MINCQSSNGRRASGNMETNEGCGPTPVETWDSERAVGMEAIHSARLAGMSGSQCDEGCFMHPAKHRHWKGG